MSLQKPYSFDAECLNHVHFFVMQFLCMQKKKEEESAREKELNELFKVAISQPKVPLGMLTVFLLY